MIEFDVMAKDYIKLNFLTEVLNLDTIEFWVYLESNGVEKNFKEIRTEKNVYRFNNFNVSEDVTKNTITFRPIVIGCFSYFRIKTATNVKIEIIKNGTTSVAKEFVLRAGNNKIELAPQGIQKYIMKIEDTVSGEINSAIPEPVLQNTEASATTPTSDTVQNLFGGFDSFMDSQSSAKADIIDRSSTASANAPTATSGNSLPHSAGLVEPHFSGESSFGGSTEDIRRLQDQEKKRGQMHSSNERLEEDIKKIESEIQALEERNAQLVNNKTYLIDKMDRLQKEFDKNYASYEADIEEIKSRYNIDQEILKLYADKELITIDELLSRAEADVKQIEEQVNLFVEAQQRKTAEIENELKIGKKE